MPFKTLNSLKPRLDLSDLSENPKPILRPQTAKATTPCCEIRAANPEAQCNCSFVHNTTFICGWIVLIYSGSMLIASSQLKHEFKVASTLYAIFLPKFLIDSLTVILLFRGLKTKRSTYYLPYLFWTLCQTVSLNVWAIDRLFYQHHGIVDHSIFADKTKIFENTGMFLFIVFVDIALVGLFLIVPYKSQKKMKKEEKRMENCGVNVEVGGNGEVNVDARSGEANVEFANGEENLEAAGNSEVNVEVGSNGEENLDARSGKTDLDARNDKANVEVASNISNV